MKWLWLCRTSNDKPWTCDHLPCSDNAKAIFHALVILVLGNCEFCLFWKDKWIDNQSVDMIAHLLLNFFDQGALHSRTVAQGLVAHFWVCDLSADLSIPTLVQYLHLWNKIVGMHFLEDEADSFKCIWTTSSDFMAKSAYIAFFEGHTLWPLHDPIWKCKAPMKFKLFAWKVVWNRCWTGDRRFRHGLSNDDSCTFCLQHSETIEHLLLQCPFSRSIWFEVL
jgi:hypothetical protein